MGIVYTEWKCERPGCKTIKRVQGAEPDKIPDDWGEVLGKTLCPECYASVKRIVFPKVRADKGSHHEKKTPVGKPAPATKKGQRQRKPHDPVASGPKDKDFTTPGQAEQASDSQVTETQASADKWRKEHGQSCPGCLNKERASCILTGTKALDCWTAKQKGKEA